MQLVDVVDLVAVDGRVDAAHAVGQIDALVEIVHEVAEGEVAIGRDGHILADEVAVAVLVEEHLARLLAIEHLGLVGTRVVVVVRILIVIFVAVIVVVVVCVVIVVCVVVVVVVAAVGVCVVVVVAVFDIVVAGVVVAGAVVVGVAAGGALLFVRVRVHGLVVRVAAALVVEQYLLEVVVLGRVVHLKRLAIQVWEHYERHGLRVVGYFRYRLTRSSAQRRDTMNRAGWLVGCDPILSLSSSLLSKSQ